MATKKTRTRNANKRIRATKLHGFTRENGQQIAYYRDGNVRWVCIRDGKGWYITDEYEYIA